MYLCTPKMLLISSRGECTTLYSVTLVLYKILYRAEQLNPFVTSGTYMPHLQRVRSSPLG